MQPATSDPSILADAIAAIHADGYIRLPGVFDTGDIERVRAEIDSLTAQARDENTSALPRLDRGQRTIYNLQAKSAPCLHLLLRSETIRALLMHFLNDAWHRAIPLEEPNYILRSFSARDNRVAAPMHIDSFIPYRGPHAISMQVSIIVDDHTPDNGCTRVVPGSHQSGEYVEQSARSDAVAVEARAGDVVVWDSRIWHGTGENTTGLPRWSLIATFVRWWIKQGYEIPRNLPQVIYASLTDSEKAVLGYCALPFEDERGGVDFKQGYPSLRPSVDEYRRSG